MTLWQQMSQVDMQDVIYRFTHAQSDFNYMILKYWCSVPHCQCDIRNIYIKADRFPLMLTTANKERKQI
jgi:hypothetical protein